MRMLKSSPVSVMKSNLKDDTPLWQKDTPYKKGTILKVNKSLYEVKKEVILKDAHDVLGEPTKIAVDYSDLEFYEPLGGDNTWACFDIFHSSQSRALGRVELWFKPEFSDALYLGNLHGRYALIEIYNAHTDELLESVSVSLVHFEIRNWKEYFFERWEDRLKKDVYYRKKNMLRNVYFHVVILNPNKGEARVGSVVSGKETDIGLSVFKGNSFSALDYSKVTTTELGRSFIKKGIQKKTNAFQIIIDTEELDYAFSKLLDHHGEAVVFVVDDSMNALMNFGILKKAEVSLEVRAKSFIDIELEGLG